MSFKYLLIIAVYFIPAHLLLVSLFKVSGLTNETSSFQMKIDTGTEDDIIEDKADGIHHLLYWPGLISPILAFSFFW